MMTQFIPSSSLLEDEVVFYMVVGNFVHLLVRSTDDATLARVNSISV